MKLELTHRNLRRISEIDDPAIEDVLNFIYDFCQDVRDNTGAAVDKLPCREEDAMYKRLPWLGRTVMKIGKENAPLLTSESRRDRISELEGKLLELEQQAEPFEQLQAEKDAVVFELLQKQEERDALQAEVDVLKQQKAELNASVESLMKERSGLQLELESEEAKLRFRALESRRDEIERLRGRLTQTRLLRERLLADWSSPWGEETRALTADGSATELPGEILQADLDAMEKKLEQYGDGLRALVRELSSPEYRD